MITEGHATGIIKGILDEDVYARIRACRGDIRRSENKCMLQKNDGNNGGVEIHKKNLVAVVRKRTIPTERPPLVCEVSANL
jgi:hypothetical protein